MTVLKLWGNHISGPVLALAALVLGFLAAYYSNDATVGVKIVRYSAYVTGALAIFLMFVAQYDAWKLEREKYEAEAAKNGKPEIRGSAFWFRADRGIRGQSTRLGGPTVSSVRLEFKMNLCNHRQVKTNITDISLDGSRLSPPVEFAEVKSPIIGTTLEFGIAVLDVPVTTTAHIEGFSLADLVSAPIKLDNLEVKVYDGFIEPHVIPVLAEEVLRV